MDLPKIATWFTSIKPSKIVWVSPDKDITNHSMTANQILVQTLNFDEPDPDDPPGPMYVVRFPVPCPLESLAEGGAYADLLFIRQDDIDLFKVVRGEKNVVLTGNPGVGKSWFQIRFILFCARPDLYKALSGEAELPKDFLGSRDPPKYIFRMLKWEDRGCVFDLVNMSVLPASESSLANANHSAVLYEPGFSTTSAPLEGFDSAQRIMTVSPDKNRYELFLKQTKECSILIMPCHFEAEIRAIARVHRARFTTRFRKVSVEEEARDASAGEEPETPFDDEAINERLLTIGPFLRCVLDSKSKNANKVKSSELGILDLPKLLGRKVTIERNGNTFPPNYVSSRLLRYVPPRDEFSRVTTFERSRATLDAATASILDLLYEKLDDKDEKKLVRLLEGYVGK